ncbi:hypothetical protein OSB04_018718 [Centaurea solstitialis]|uniref:Cytochrome P450 n=1 Tax=Centaurea solstitialis TaxID=347529 RepID=A0AA38TCX4_9ASTR|nr:hypothetical protein OSB04_018718 [Centaurea solstitialis]
MEKTTAVSVIGVAAVILVLYVWRIFNFLWLKPKKMEKFLRDQGLKGTSYRFMVGDLKELEKLREEARSKPMSVTDHNIAPRVLTFFHKSVAAHGKTYFTWMGVRPMVHISDPTMIREVLANHFQFQKARGGNPLAKLLATGLLDVETDQWVKHRKIINPAFHVEKLKHMVPAFYVSCSEMIHKWEDMVTKENSCEVDVWPHLQTLTADVISRTAFGSSFEEGKKIFELQRELGALVMKAIASIYIPGTKDRPGSEGYDKRIIDKRVVAMNAGESINDDLLGILLDSNYKEIKQQGNNNFGLSIEEVIKECKVFYFAGQETTGNLLVWTMILLGQYKDWQTRAREEVLEVFGHERPDIDGLNHLKVVNMILNEVLRLYPPAVLLRRSVHVETKLRNLILPAGTLLQLSTLLLHHDEDVWGKDVYEFKPERFSEGVLKATKGQASYLPFGGGPRICVGQNFAMLEAKMALAMILQRFSFDLSPSYSHAPHTIITLRPHHGDNDTTATLALFVWRILNFLWLKPKKMEKFLRDQGLKGTRYRFMAGDLKEVEKMRNESRSKPMSVADHNIAPRVLAFFHKSLAAHGKTCFTWMGVRPMVHISDSTMIREVLANHFQLQKAKGGNPLTKLLVTGLLDVETDQWVKHRKIINPAFHVEKLKHMVPAFYVSCTEMIHKWEEMMAKETSCEVDVWPHLQTLTADVISRTAFGSSFEEGRKIFELQREQGALFMKAAASIYIPGTKFLPTKTNKRMKEIDREVKAMIKRIIDKRVVAMKAGQSINDDLLGFLLDSNYKEIKQHGNNNFGLSIEEVIEECKAFYFAGQETTGNLLVWTMILLGQYKDWQTHAREEVLQVFGHEKPYIDGLNHLKVVNMILNEVLRLYPPVVLLRRSVHEETKLRNLILPAGSLLQLSTLLLHHDQDIWGKDVYEFKPERFSEGVLKATKGQAAYLPFGGGPRICIGQNFAMLEAKIALAMILQRFSFDLSPSYSHAPHTIITLRPQFGAHLILHKL